jgi:hypothetical protein
MRPILQQLLYMLLVAGTGLAAPPVRLWPSPDGQLTAHVSGVGNPGFEDEESRIDIRTSVGRLVRSHSFKSVDGRHGYGIVHAEWSGDGRWFVVSCVNSGAHMPWHRPIYVYDRRTRRIFAVDQWVGSVMSDFTMVGSDGIAFKRKNPVTGADLEPIIFRPSRLNAARR